MSNPSEHRHSGPLISRRKMLSVAAAAAGGLLLGSCADSDSDSGTDSDSGAGDEPRSADPTEQPAVTTEKPAVTPDCTLTSEQIEGPFYTDVRLARADVTEGKPGSPLELSLVVVDAESCLPIPDAVVDIWHADAAGLYSAFEGQGDYADIDTTAETFLRGIQPTNADGKTTFNTIYPGWYQGRTTHIHIKIHFADQTRVTSQLFFPDDVSAGVYSNHEAYTERGIKDTPNSDDQFGGPEQDLRMTLTDSGAGHTAAHTVGIRRV